MTAVVDLASSKSVNVCQFQDMASSLGAQMVVHARSPLTLSLHPGSEKT